MTRDTIYERIWGFEFETSSKSLDVYIGYLRAKTEAKLSPKSPVDVVRASGPAAWIEAVRAAADDLREAGNVARLDLHVSPDVAIVVELPQNPAA